MPTPQIDFSPLLHRPQHASLRTRLAGGLRQAGLGGDRVWVSTLYETITGPASSPKSGPASGSKSSDHESGEGRRSADRAGEEGGADWVVLLDVRDVLVIRPAASPTGGAAEPCSECLARSAFDSHDAFADADARRLAGGDFRFVAGEASLDVLASLYAGVEPGTALHVDLAALTAEPVPALPHPDCTRCRRPAVDTGRPLSPAHGPVGDSWRQDVVVDVSGLAGAYAGLVREEAMGRDDAGTPAAIATVTRRPPAAGRVPESVACGGTSLHPDRAAFIARCEAMERAHLFSTGRGRSLVFGSYRELAPDALDPESLFVDPESGPYTPDLPMHWAWASRLPGGDGAGGEESGDGAGGERRLVPAQLLWFDTPRLDGETRCVQATSNGCAMGTCGEEAALHALLELVERDAAVTAWLLQRPLAPIDRASFADPDLHALCAAVTFAHPDYRLHLFDATAGTGVPVVWAVAEREGAGDGLRTLHTTGGGATAEAAAWAAVTELANRFGAQSEFARRRAEFEAALEDPTAVTDLAHHWGVAGLDAAASRFDFLLRSDRRAVTAAAINARSPLPSRTQAARDLHAGLTAVVDRLAECGLPAYAADLSRPEFLARGAHCVQAIVPGLYPLRFGTANQPGPITGQSRRRWRGLNAPAGLTDLPHPFG